jgi:hypothetical protein
MPDRLSSLILDHWKRHHPKMLAQLQRENKLEQELHETAERFADLLYQMVSVRKVGYGQAWELAMNEFFLPEESPLSQSPKRNLPATSG